MTTQTYPCVGIDISKAHFDICCLFEDGRQPQNRFDNNRSGLRKLRTWLQKQEITPAKVCLEATSHYGMLVTFFFYNAGWTVYVINPAISHASLGGTQRRTKTDKSDARDLAFFLEGHHRRLHPFAPLAPEYQQLRWFVRELTAISRAIARTKVSMEKVGYMSGVAQRVIQKKLERDLEYHEREQEAMLKHVQALMNEHAEMKQRSELLQTVPGVGPVTAMHYMAEIPDPKRFTNKRQVAAHAGLTPRVRHSGSHQPVSQPISKTGSRHLRSAAYMASLSAGQRNPVLKPTDLRLKSNGKAPKVAKVAVARKLVEMLFVIEKNNRPFDPNCGTKKSTTTGAI
jgi:transposase